MFLRRKFPTKKIDDPSSPPVPGSGASLPPRPKQLNEAAARLSGELGIAVAPGYGFGDDPKDRSQGWRLFALSLDENVCVPAAFQGFSVARRAAVVVPPAWGKAAARRTRRW